MACSPPPQRTEHRTQFLRSWPTTGGHVEHRCPVLEQALDDAAADGWTAVSVTWCSPNPQSGAGYMIVLRRTSRDSS